MKKPLQLAAAGASALIILTLIFLRIFGLQPQDQRPGLWLPGSTVVSAVDDWSFTDEYDEVFVQTNTIYGIPHSVTTYSTDYNGEFYLFSAYYGGGNFPEDRSWNRNVMRDPRVRIKIGEDLYDRALRYIEDEALRVAVHRELELKYPDWSSPGLDNVYIFRVEPSG